MVNHVGVIDNNMSCNIIYIYKSYIYDKENMINLRVKTKKSNLLKMLRLIKKRIFINYFFFVKIEKQDLDSL